MFAVRSIFARPAQLAATMKELAAAGLSPAWLAERDHPLDFLVHEGGASSLTDAAYRYVRHEPGVDVVLFGTGDAAHLRTNIESILKPALPDADRQRGGFKRATGPQVVTLALKAGVHPEVVSERLGHATVAITLDLYSHVTPAIARDAADVVAAKIFGA